MILIFQNIFFPLFVILFSLILIIWGFKKLLKRNLERKIKFILFFSRSLLLLLTILMLIEPKIKKFNKIKFKENIYILFDTSQSMQLPNVENSNGKKILNLYESTSEFIKKNFNPKYFIFNSSITPIKENEIKDLKFYGKGTNLYDSSLIFIKRFIEKERKNKILVFTDGIDNNSNFNHFKSKIPIFFILSNKENKTEKDASILDVSTPEHIKPNENTTIKVFLLFQNVKDSEYELILSLNDEKIDNKRLTINEIFEKREITLNFNKKEGIYACEILLKPINTEEYTLLNNKIYKIFEVVEYKKHILLVSSPSWDTKFLSRFLNLKEQLKSDFLIYAGDKFITLNNNYLSKFPSNLKEYNLIILGAVSFLKTENLEQIKKYMQENGNIIFLFSKIHPYFSLNKNIKFDTVKENFIPQITQDGLENELMKLSELKEKNMKIWKNLPIINEFIKLENVKNQAKVLLEHPTKNCGEAKCPLLFIENIYNSQNLIFLFPGLWKLNFTFYGKEYFNKYYETFFNNIIETFSSQKLNQEGIALKKREYELGEPIEFKILSSKNNIEIYYLNNKNKTNLEFIKEANKIKFTPYKVGIYVIKYKDSMEEYKEEKLIVNYSLKETTLIIKNKEKNNLKKLGKVIYETKSLKKALSPTTTIERKPYDVSLMNNWIIFLIILIILLTEWLFKKKFGID